MNFPETFVATGTLLGLGPGNSGVWPRNIKSVEQEDAGVRGWHRLLWRVDQPLAGEILSGDKVFTYPFLFRSSREREHALLFGYQGSIVEEFLRRCLSGLRVTAPSVAIPRLMTDLVASPGEYLMGAIYAKVEGHGQQLRNISLYGSDVGGAEILEPLLPSLKAYRVTLRRMDTGKEVLSIGSRGEASFLYRGRSSLKNVDAVLRFLVEQRYINWSRRSPVNLR